MAPLLLRWLLVIRVMSIELRVSPMVGMEGSGSVAAWVRGTRGSL